MPTLPANFGQLEMSSPADSAYEPKGFIYVLSTKAMPDLLKIGFSLKHPTIRAQELSGSGMPHPYCVEYCAFLRNPYEVEQAVHQVLAEKHEAKEFFRISPDDAIRAISTLVRGMGHTVLYEEGGLKARELEKEQAAKEALALAEERRRKWWLKCAPSKTFVIKDFDPIVERVEELIPRVDLREDTQDGSQVFTVLKRLRMPEGYVLGWGHYANYVFENGVRYSGIPEVWFFSRRSIEGRPETLEAIRKLPKRQLTFPFGIEVIRPSMSLPDHEFPIETILSYVELGILQVLRYAFVGRREAFVICGESSLRRRIDEERHMDRATSGEAIQLDLSPRVTVSCETEVPSIDVQLVTFDQGWSGSTIGRTSITFSLTEPLRVLDKRRKNLLGSEAEASFIFSTPPFFVMN